MYRFLFYFIYKGQLKDNKGAVGPSRFMASLFITMSFFFNIAFLFVVARFLIFHYYGTHISFFWGKTYATKWLITVIFLLPIFMPVYNYYSEKRIQEITSYYSEREVRMYTVLNFVKFFSIYLIPLLSMIYMLNHTKG